MGAAIATDRESSIRELAERGVLTVTTKRMCELLSSDEWKLRRFAKRHPDRLTRIPWGKRGCRWRMDQIIELAKSGMSE